MQALQLAGIRPFVLDLLPPHHPCGLVESLTGLFACAISDILRPPDVTPDTRRNLVLRRTLAILHENTSIHRFSNYGQPDGSWPHFWHNFLGDSVADHKIRPKQETSFTQRE